jgi:hypothetical protein
MRFRDVVVRLATIGMDVDPPATRGAAGAYGIIDAVITHREVARAGAGGLAGLDGSGSAETR